MYIELIEKGGGGRGRKEGGGEGVLIVISHQKVMSGD